MSTSPTLLCIHRDPAQLRSLQENGYQLLTATNGHDGLRLFASQPVDAIVLDYHLGLLDGTLVANVIKRVRPTIPIVMLADNLELPYDALNSVDALVTKSDGAHFLWATVHFVLNVKPAQNREGKHQSQTRPSPDPKAAPFSAREWRNIRAGTIQF
jgi:DNA-binding response OmpR family regulator